MIPARYSEGKEGVLGAETEEWMRYKVCSLLVVVRWTLLDEQASSDCNYVQL
jgi:hypothetical protein